MGKVYAPLTPRLVSDCYANVLDRSWVQLEMKTPITALDHLPLEISVTVTNFFLAQDTELWSLYIKAVYTITELLP